MGNPSRMALAALLVMSPAGAYGQELSADLQQQAEGLVVALLQQQLPSELELYYLEDTDDAESSLALRYEWNANREWDGDVDASDPNFDALRANFFIKGNYVFQDDVDHAEFSEIGGAYSRRWLRTPVSNPLTPEQREQVDECLLDSADFNVTVDECRQRLGFGETDLTYWYVDLGLQAKVEADQDFEQRHYVYGAHVTGSMPFGEQRLIQLPRLTVGIEQVDPKDDEARQAAGASDDVYVRFYAEAAFTGILFRLNEQNIKWNFSWRYFDEISPDDQIESADLDEFDYGAVAIQVPAVLIPGFDNPRNSLVVSYGWGQLPFDRDSDRTIAIGFRHDFDPAAFF